MAIVTTERPAIENLFGGAKETQLPNTNVGEVSFCFDDGTPLYALGLSIGSGIYSRCHGVAVLVLTTEEGQYERRYQIGEVKWVVLHRRSTPQEMAEDGNGNCRACFELLEVIAQSETRITFRKTGKKELYVPM